MTDVKYFRVSDGQEVAADRVEYWYDTNPHDTSYTQYGWGRLTAVRYRVRLSDTASHLVTEMYSYTQYGAIAKKRMRIERGSGTQNLEVAYTFDGEGRPLTMQYPRGMVVSYQYDTMSRLSGIKEGTTDLAYGVEYGVANELKKLNLETREYNVLGQMTRVQEKACPGCSNFAVDLSYNYKAGENNGQIQSMRDNLTCPTGDIVDTLDRRHS